MRRPRVSWLLLGAVFVVASAATSVVAWACPYCTAQSQTLSEELQSMDAAIIAKMVVPPEKPDPASKEFVVPKAVFEIVEVLKGDAIVKPGQRVTALFYSEPAPNKEYLLLGVQVVAAPTKPADTKARDDDKPAVSKPDVAPSDGNIADKDDDEEEVKPTPRGGSQMTWSTPIIVSELVKEYLHQLPKLPKEGVERLAYFHKFLQHKEDLLARDAFDEFARAPYTAVQELKPRMNREQLWTWIRDPELQTFRRRLYLTMLGVCGTEEDVPELEALMRSEDRAQRTALDALIGAYLTLKGESGVALVEDLFLKAPKDDAYSDMYSTIMSLRILAEEIKTVPLPRIVQAFRVVLDHPKFADLVIPDLARMEDWESLDRMVAMYRDADPKTSFVRVPIVNFVRACPLPEAAKALEKLQEIDPDSVRRATTIFPLGPRPTDTKKVKPESSYYAPEGDDAPTLAATDPPTPLVESPAEMPKTGPGARDMAVQPASAIVPDATDVATGPSATVSTRRRALATNAGVDRAKAIAKNSLPPPNRWLVPGVTAAVGLAMFVAQCWLLGGRAPASGESVSQAS